MRTSQDLADLQPAEMMKIFKKFANAINADRRRTIDEISEVTGLSWSSCQRILMEYFNVKRTSLKTKESGPSSSIHSLNLICP